MKLKDVVVTSVTRDDLADGGAGAWAATIRAVRDACPGIRIEALVPDFAGSAAALEAVLAARPDILGHNLETVPALYPEVRRGANYSRSLGLLARAHEAGAVTKTSLMLGLGESADQAAAVMRDARGAGCDIFFIGQYLQPTKDHAPVREYVAPAGFESLRELGIRMGFPVVVAGPLVRSSYHSAEQDGFMDRLAGKKTCRRRKPGGSGR
jgi:lipoic acid synthetase